MGRSHAASGAAGWLVACATVTALGHRPAFTTVALGAVVAAGCAVAPDADHPQATVARVFGPLSQAGARLVARGCARVHEETRTPLDQPRRGGHRTLSHTAVAALAAGWATAVVCVVIGAAAALVVVFVTAGLAARSLLSKRTRGDWGATSFAVITATIVAWGTTATASWWWLGVPVAFGWLVHLGGDALTNSGCPILWPVVIRGRRWYLVGTPKAIRFCTGGWCEQWLVLPALAVSGLVSAGWLLAMV